MSINNISILIVDDEPEARDLLNILLDRIGGVEVVGTAEGVDEAFIQILKKQPNLVLLDIQMPQKNGFELVRMVHDKQLPTGFIFVTAYEEYAIEAIRVSAFDYLLKPVDIDELNKSVIRFRDHLMMGDIRHQLGEMLQGLSRKSSIKVNTRTGFILINPDEVVHCVAAGNYTEVHLVKNRVETITSNLGSFMELLAGKSFFRISRSAMINLDYLIRVDYKSGTCRLRGESDIELKVARNRRKELDQVVRNS